ncbi:hypothetical protein LIA77_11324 [Sarocladium implicatum]|nr:hypothetical protein LIA77_11324 [Sarocladium implicatum]
MTIPGIPLYPCADRKLSSGRHTYAPGGRRIRTVRVLHVEIKQKAHYGYWHDLFRIIDSCRMSSSIWSKSRATIMPCWADHAGSLCRGERQARVISCIVSIAVIAYVYLAERPDGRCFWTSIA